MNECMDEDEANDMLNELDDEEGSYLFDIENEDDCIGIQPSLEQRTSAKKVKVKKKFRTMKKVKYHLSRGNVFLHLLLSLSLLCLRS